jgi:hypothetical protein
MAILRTYGRLKEHLQGHRILSKLITLKVLVALELIQRTVFSALTQHNVLKQSTYISYMDWTVGIPQFLTVCEMFLFCWSFIYAYTWKPYRLGNALSVEKHSFGRGIFESWNIIDIIYGMFFTLKLRSIVKESQSESLPTYGRQTGYAKDTGYPESGYGQQQQYGHV